MQYCKRLSSSIHRQTTLFDRWLTVVASTTPVVVQTSTGGHLSVRTRAQCARVHNCKVGVDPLETTFSQTVCVVCIKAHSLPTVGDSERPNGEVDMCGIRTRDDCVCVRIEIECDRGACALTSAKDRVRSSRLRTANVQRLVAREREAAEAVHAGGHGRAAIRARPTADVRRNVRHVRHCN